MAATINSISQKIADAIENLMTLRVVTIVAPITVNNVNDTDGKADIAFPPGNTSTDCATTSINLIAGDITQVRSPKFVTDPAYAKMHDDALTAARTIVADNLAALKSAIVGLEKLLPKG